MRRTFFSKLFPVPNYLRFPAVGFDVSNGSVKFLELLSEGDSVTVGHFGNRPFAGDLGAVLSSIRRQCGFEMVNISVPEEESFFVRIRLPFIRPEEVRGAIELQLEEYIPYTTREVEFDYEILKSDPKPGGYVDVNVAVLHQKMVGKYLSIFKQAGLTPVSLMIEAEATSRAAVPSDVNAKDAVMVVNIGKSNTVLSVVAAGSVWFSYTINLGGDLLARRLEEMCNMSANEAEAAKDEKGLIDSSENQRVFECLLPTISGVSDEMTKHRRYWSKRREESLMDKDIDEINRIIICGSQSTIPGLMDYFSTTQKLRAVLANPWANVLNLDRYIPPIGYKDSLEYATAIGLGLSSLE